MNDQATNPTGFINPHSHYNKVGRVLWHLVYVTLFRPSPRFMSSWRSFLLRCFGARLKNAHFHPSSRIWAPWLLEAGEFVYVDENVYLYNAYGIILGNRVIISQKSFLCSASHDYRKSSYPLTGGRIVVEDDSWIAADVFIGPGVTIHTGAVVGARSNVFKDVAAWTVVGGNPAATIKHRVIDTK